MGEVVIERLLNDRLDHYWPAIETGLDSVVDVWSPWWTKDALRNQAEIGRFQVWAIGDEDRISVVVFTQVLVYPASSVIQAFLAFGRGLDDVLAELVTLLERFAIAQGCSSAEVVGRHGWVKKLRSFGYAHESSYVRKALPLERIH